MITFLTSPKPFVGIDKENQYRAIRNWKLVANNAEIILYGNSDGIDTAAEDLNVKIVKNIKSTKGGIPYFGSIVNHASEFGIFDIQIYLNCDILLGNIDQVINKVTISKFLCIGQRIDLSSNFNIDISPSSLKFNLRSLYTKEKIDLHKPTGIDYFIFRRSMWNHIGEIVIGRGGYDNALLRFCKLNHISIIDCTNMIVALHQFHDYNHVIGNKKSVFLGNDAKNNLKQAGKYSLLTITDSDYIFYNNKLIINKCRGDILRFLELNFKYNYNFVFLSYIIRFIWRILIKLNIINLQTTNLIDLITIYETEVSENE